MDDTDLDIFRWMYPGGVRSPWGTDPRLSVAEISSHVGLDRTRVWARIRKWRREGFWDGFRVTPNLAIFGVEMLSAEIVVPDAAEGCALLDRVETMEGALRAWLAYGDSATRRDVEALVVDFVGDDPARVARRMGFLRRLSPSGRVDGPYPRPAPPCSRALTPLDWRIIAAVLANPNAPPSKVAPLVGVTFKTFVRHHSALIDDHAVFYDPKIDWSRLGCVTLGIHCVDAADVGRVQAALEARFPHSIPINLDGWDTEGVAPEFDRSRCFAIIVPSHSPNDLQTLVASLSRVPGVRMVRTQLFGPVRQYNRWINQQVTAHLAT